MATKQVCHLDGLLAAIVAPAILTLSASAQAALPIRTSLANQVPPCVTPERPMAFLGERNANLAPRYRGVARWYKYCGEGWRVRWDYAFFQMAIETNFLSFRRGGGRRGDVSEVQNNFAGIGATGGRARGERFPDVATGLHAQIQHLVACSGERLVAPIAKRTRERQDDIVEASQLLGRPVTFADLSRRWAVDRAYGKSIDFVADPYRAQYCGERSTRTAEELRSPAPVPARREWRYPFRPPSGLGGPKPQKLAGPAGPESEPPPEGGEVLPWLALPAQPAPSTQPERPADLARAKPTGKVKRAAKPSPKVKTIWSRGDDSGNKDAHTLTPRPGLGNSWADGTVARQGAAAPPGLPSDESQAPVLPTFRIAPVAAEASRLGGPLPADLRDPAATLPPTSPLASCRVLSGSYGGTKTLLIRSTGAGETQYTALTVIDGFERSMFEAYARAEAARADIIGEYSSRDAALADAYVNCPRG
jgi:hypothetical protein